MVDAILIRVVELKREIGEMAILSDIINKPVFLTEDSYDFAELKATELGKARKASFQAIHDSLDSLKREGLMAYIDQLFMVKGTGKVLLGIVKSGVIEKHGNYVAISPEGEKHDITVKSIQRHGKPVEFANAGTRFGIAVKCDAMPERGWIVVDKDMSEKMDVETSFLLEKTRFSRKVPGQVMLSSGPAIRPGILDGNRISSKIIGLEPIIAFSPDAVPRVVGKAIQE